MGRKSKFIEKLTEEERIALQKGYSHGKSPLFRRKCHCILQSNTGKTTKELASFFQVSKISILKWLGQWEKEGLQGLQLKPGRGRKAKLKTDNAAHVKLVKTLIEKECQNLNPVVAKVSDQLDISLSKKTLKRFLKNLNTGGNVFADV